MKYIHLIFLNICNLYLKRLRIDHGDAANRLCCSDYMDANIWFIYLRTNILTHTHIYIYIYRYIYIPMYMYIYIYNIWPDELYPTKERRTTKVLSLDLPKEEKPLYIRTLPKEKSGRWPAFGIRLRQAPNVNSEAHPPWQEWRRGATEAQRSRGGRERRRRPLYFLIYTGTQSEFKIYLEGRASQWLPPASV